MSLLLPRVFAALPAAFFISLFIVAFFSAPAIAQSYCGPNTAINFNNTNGSYPYAGVTFDRFGNMYGTTTNGGASGFGTIWKYKSSAGLNQLSNLSGSSSPSNNGDRDLWPKPLNEARRIDSGR